MALRKRKPKKELPAPEVNITSLMDVLTTLLFFIVMMASFNEFLVLPATPLLTGKSDSADQKPVFTLKIAVLDDKTLKLWLGPVAELAMVNRGENTNYFSKRFSGSPQTGFGRTIKERSTEKLLSTLQDILQRIKTAFPHETKAVVAFANQVNYQTTVDTISSVRSIAAEKPALEVENLLGKTENTRVLFPEVIISEWNEGS